MLTLPCSLFEEVQEPIMNNFSVTLLIVVLLHFGSYGSQGYSQFISVDSSSDLERCLCNKTWSSQYLVFSLNSSTNFTLSGGNFCQVTNNANIVEIRSNSLTEPASITCINNDIDDIRKGFIFSNSTVILHQLVVKNCGAFLNTLQDNVISNYIKTSSLFYNPFHAAAFVFVHCQINMTQVNIYSYGFAVIGINLHKSIIKAVGVSNRDKHINIDQPNGSAIGSGILLRYENMRFLPTNEYTVTISHSSFMFNYNMNRNFTAAGLTILYLQKTYNASVVIDTSSFCKNNAYTSGGLLILQEHIMSKTIVNNSLFQENFNYPKVNAGGGAMVYELINYEYTLLHVIPLFIFNTSFQHHLRGALYIGAYNPTNTIFEIILKNCTFFNNTVYWMGGCIFATQYSSNGKLQQSVVITLDSMISKTNHDIHINAIDAANVGSQRTLFLFYGFNKIHIRGISIFDDHFGIVIYSVDSSIYLSGNVTFSNNRAVHGPAITQSGNCQLYFTAGVKATFANNNAILKGGAIYATGTSQTLLGKCAIQIDNSSDTEILFSYNDAGEAGSSIYADPIVGCVMNGTSYDKKDTALFEYYNRFFKFSSNSTLLDISTVPYYMRNPSNQTLYQVYPGQTLYFCFYAYAYAKGYVHSSVNVAIKYYNSVENNANKVWISIGDKEQVLQENKNCTNISVTVHTNNNTYDTNASLLFIGEQAIEKRGDYAKLIRRIVLIYSCPLGFVLNPTTGNCECSQSFYSLKENYPILGQVYCNLTTQTISRAVSTNSWAGITNWNGKGETGVSLNCPIGYCNSDQSLTYFYSANQSSNGSFQVSDTEHKHHFPLCLYNREGPLCGRCSNELSVVFGSTECKHCSNWWLLTILVYAVAGPLLIYLLYALRLTLTTGTLNGIIFYAQAANCGLIDIFNTHCSKSIVEGLSKFSLVFLSLLNTNLAIPLCFYNGMTELWKAGFSLLFPLYLLTIIAAIVVISHYYVRLANRLAGSTVQVLVTAFLPS